MLGCLFPPMSNSTSFSVGFAQILMDALRAALADRAGLSTSSPLPFATDVLLSGVALTGLAFVLYLVVGLGLTAWALMRPGHGRLLKRPWTVGDRAFLNQCRRELLCACGALPLLSAVVAPLDAALRRGSGAMSFAPLGLTGGASAAYHGLVVLPLFVVGVDAVVYWLHRGMHQRTLYRLLGHNIHHRERFVTPFSSFAFHPIDGGLQATPGYLFFFLVPCHPQVAAALLALSNLWVFMLHDVAIWRMAPIFATSQDHTVHHEAFDFNYGQFTTLWDRLFGTYRPYGADVNCG